MPIHVVNTQEIRIHCLAFKLFAREVKCDYSLCICVMFSTITPRLNEYHTFCFSSLSDDLQSLADIIDEVEAHCKHSSSHGNRTNLDNSAADVLNNGLLDGSNKSDGMNNTEQLEESQILEDVFFIK